MERSELENNTHFKDMVKHQYEGKEGAKESIWYEKFQTKTVTCDITGETCREGECCIGCKIAETYVLKERENDLLGLFPTEDHEQRGVKCKTNWNNSFYEFNSVESLKNSTEYPQWVDKLNHLKELKEEVKVKYHVWNECSEMIKSMFPVVEYMYLSTEYPLIIVCEDRIFAEAPYIEE